MLSTLSTFFTMLTEAFKDLSIFKKRQSETRVLSNSKKDKQALKWALRIIALADTAYLVDRYGETTPLDNDKDYKKYKANFFKYIADS
jgi:hypothetical protein